MIKNSIFNSNSSSSKNSVLKDEKNKESRAFTFDAQRLHRIQLRTVELLNQYFHKIEDKNTGQQPKEGKKASLSRLMQLRNRFFHLSSQNQQKIAQEMNEVKQLYRDIYRSEQLKEMERKLRRVKTTSSTLDKEIKLYEQHLIEELKDLNLQGNDWIEMNLNNKIKQEWRKRNLQEVRQYKVNNEGFFNRKPTTDYETEKNRIISNIKKLRLQTKNSLTDGKPQANPFILQIGDEKSEKEYSIYEHHSKFMQRAWNPNKSRASSFKQNRQNQQKSRKILASSEEKKNQQIFGWEINVGDLSKFQDQYQTLEIPIFNEKPERKLKIRKSLEKVKVYQKKPEQNLKLTRKWSQNTKQNQSVEFQSSSSKFHNTAKSGFQPMRNRQVKIRLANDKMNIKQPRPSKKLVL